MEDQQLILLDNFNKNGNIELLIFIFTFENNNLEEYVRQCNDTLDPKWFAGTKFTLIKLTDNHIVFINELEEISLIPTDHDSLLILLNEIKKINDCDSSDLRTAILLAGKGFFKSYDVYTTIDTSNLDKPGIKKLLINDSIWTKERLNIHNKILSSRFEDIKELSESIEKSSNMDNGLYCVRGSVASGKSKFVQEYLKDKIGLNQPAKGVLNTDVIKNSLLRHSKNFI